MNIFQTFQKKKDFLICIDSDGCAMDTMDIKHIRCFGPCMVTEWNLDEWRDPILKRWNDINLYTMTRGINRFKGLVTALLEINDTYCPIEDLDSLVQWVGQTDELSNASLQRAIDSTGSISLKKALAWSVSVNQAITALPEESVKPFPGVKEALALAHRYADVAIVSSANLEAVTAEWEKFGLMEDVDIVLTQNIGSKAFCIGQMLECGYSPDHVMMAGDAPGDRDAAASNQVLYYPILVRKEETSWKEFSETALHNFLQGTYKGEYEQQKVAAFIENLS